MRQDNAAPFEESLVMSQATRVKLFSAAFLVLLFTSTTAYGQAVYGSIFGTVVDASGAVVPNATIVVTDVAKGTSVTVQSNAAGEFTADHLIPDVYDLKVTAQGFQGFSQTGIQVFADTSIRVQATLQIGAADTVVEVRADTLPLLKTDRADVSTVFGSREIQELPIPGRNFTGLQLLLPGAQELGWSHAASENPQGSKQIMVAGQHFAGVAFELDGTDNQDPILGIIVVNPNLDSLSETKITTQNYDAEFGKAVASVVTAQTKSGTNNFHGSAFWYRTSGANLAQDPFKFGPGRASIPPQLKSQFGGSIGGPVLKNKLFFFGDYQGVRQKLGTGNIQTVPSVRLMETCLGKLPTVLPGVAGCDFSEYLNQVTPAGTGIIYRANGTPYPGNVIPAAEVSQQAKNLFALLEPYKPNQSGSFGGLKNNYSGSGTGALNSDQWDVRGDFTMSEKTHFFGRFSRFTDTLTGAVMFGPAGGAGFGLGGYGGTSQGANASVAAGTDIVLNSHLITDIRLGYFRYNISTSKYDQNVPLANQLGIPGLNLGTDFTNGAPGFNITDVGSTGAPSNPQNGGAQYGSSLNANRCNCPLKQHEDQYQIVNNWTKVLGNHSLKVGGDLRYARNLRVPSDNNRTGLLDFSNQPTSNPSLATPGGLGFATFVLGKVTNFQRFVSTSTNAKEFQKRMFFYAQDTWRATPKLTVNYGLRYEFYFPETINSAGNGALLNVDTGYLYVAGVGGVGSNMNWGRQTNAWAPRIGVAWQVHPTTVLRAGYGRSFDIGVFGSIFGHAATQNLPVLSNQQITSTTGPLGSAFTLDVGPPLATPITVPSNGLLPNPGSLVQSRARPNSLRLPTLDAWNASLEEALKPSLSLTIAYVGNKGTHTLFNGTDNSSNPNEAAINLPAQYSITGNPLHFDPSVTSGISASGGTSNTTFLRRYYGGKYPACADPAYKTPAGVSPGQCGWTNDLTFYGNNADSHYHSLQVSLAKQFTHGLSANANYAWQSATNWANNFSTWNKNVVKGNDAYVRRQQIIMYGLYELPFGRNKRFGGDVNGVVNQIIGGWQLSPVLNFSSGLPFTLTLGGCGGILPGSAPCYMNGDRHRFQPHITGAPFTALHYFDQTTLATIFPTPGVNQIGTLGRNSLWGPHFFNMDLAVQKSFPIHEAASIQFRMDAFNTFNYQNFGTPSGGDGSITQGPGVDGTTNPRQLQFSLRVQF
jgi:outer membrane receptor protein involved in Fe transport